ncbi:uncharacterized protein LOC123469806 isoform X1 [Daphnia magna]|uniref:uncharacterized protein LOC123469806 isoform X1 n=1 Tax=Daphnia magna TaxID=35525 RepID=UPI001E1BD66F|nr:uncharacterized protein LOC123469806 isoform X1 [Daphnia magna]XP_045025070.1 uncharacterized protein LOC123469806 isoform X1 [Daphnia magna]
MVSLIATIVVVLLLSVSGPQMVSAAPIRQQRADVGQNEDSLKLEADSNLADDWTERKYPPPTDDVDTTHKYTHGHGIVTSSLVQEPSPISEAVVQHSVLTDQEELDSTINDLLSQLQTDLTTGLVSTAGLLPDINFMNTDTDVVIVDAPPPVEAVEAEDDDEFVEAVEENQPSSVPAVSNLANLLFPQSDSSPSSAASSSSSSSSSDNFSSGGILGGSVSSTSIANPFVILFSYGLAAVSVFALTLPLWVPFVVAKRRHALGPLRKKLYPLNRKKAAPLIPANQTIKQPEIYYQQQENEKLPYSHYEEGFGVTQPPSAGIAEMYHFADGSPDIPADVGLHLGPYSAFFSNSLWPKSDEQLSDPGPLKSKSVYGPISNFFLKAAHKNSIRRRLQKKKQ